MKKLDKILCGIPCLYGADHCKEAIDSVLYKEGVSVLLIDNGAETAVKSLIEGYSVFPSVAVIRNEQNIFVNPAWNQIIEYFLCHDFDRLIIMNSDLILHTDWLNVTKYMWQDCHDDILLPVIVDAFPKYISAVHCFPTIVNSGTPGVFITLTRRQAEIIYPIPSEIKVWFGDLYLFTVLRQLGYRTIIPENLYAKHYWSSTVSKVVGISDIIEQDKEQWEVVVEKYLLPLIAKTKNEAKHYSQ